jgi:hypothetical protein
MRRRAGKFGARPYIGWGAGSDWLQSEPSELLHSPVDVRGYAH